MLNGFDYNNFTDYLKERIEASLDKEVNSLETLIEYYTDNPPETMFPHDEFFETDSDYFKEFIEDLAQDTLLELEKKLSEDEELQLTIKGEKWQLQQPDIPEPDETKTKLYNNLLTDEEKLLSTSLWDVNDSKRHNLIDLYKQKVKKLGTLKEKYETLQLIGDSYLHKHDDHIKNIELLSEAGKIGRQLKASKSYKYYEEAAKIYRKNYAHDLSAEQFSLAIETAKDCGEDSSVILFLIKCMRIQYELSGEEESAASAFIKENDLKVKINGGIAIKFVFLILKGLSDYCQNPRKVAFWAAGLILFSAFIYCFIGVTPSGQAEQSLLNNCNDPIQVILDSLYFSVVTFTTLGYGDFSPSGFSRLMATIEALGGLFFTSLFLVTLVRKYGR